MAQKIQVLLTCDVCSGDTPGTETINFSLEGRNFEIDVCDRHASQLRDAVAPFSGAGRRAGGSSGGGRGGRRGAAAAGSDRARTQAIRAWAKSRGIKVSERGRISADVAKQYDAANR